MKIYNFKLRNYVLDLFNKPILKILARKFSIMTEVNCDLISLAQKINLCLSLKHSNPLCFKTNSLPVMKEINETISKVKVSIKE